MTPTERPLSELRTILHAVCEETATQAQVDRLAELVHADQRAKQEYLEYMSLHADLTARFSEDPLAMMREATRPLPSDGELPETEPAIARKARWWTTAREWAVSSASLSIVVAGLFLTVILLSLALWRLPHLQQPLPDEEAIARSQLVAQVVQTRSARWSAASDVELGARTSLFVGQRIELEAGFAKIEFDSGAVAQLVAPVSFTVEGANAARVASGVCLVRADSEASHGFTLHLPAGSVVDTGTEFGVEVDEEQATQVAVFEGGVEVRGRGETVAIAAGQSAEVSPLGVVRVSDAAAEPLVAHRRQAAIRFAPPLVFRVEEIPTGAGDEVVLTEGEYILAVNCGPASPAVEVHGVLFHGSEAAAAGIDGVRIISTAQKRSPDQLTEYWQEDFAELFRAIDASIHGESFTLTISGLVPGERYRAQFIAGQGVGRGAARARRLQIASGGLQTRPIDTAAAAPDGKPGSKSIVAEFTADATEQVFQLTPVDRGSRASLAAVALFRIETQR